MGAPITWIPRGDRDFGFFGVPLGTGSAFDLRRRAGNEGVLDDIGVGQRIDVSAETERFLHDLSFVRR